MAKPSRKTPEGFVHMLCIVWKRTLSVKKVAHLSAIMPQLAIPRPESVLLSLVYPRKTKMSTGESEIITGVTGLKRFKVAERGAPGKGSITANKNQSIMSNGRKTWIRCLCKIWKAPCSILEKDAFCMDLSLSCGRFTWHCVGMYGKTRQAKTCRVLLFCVVWKK